MLTPTYRRVSDIGLSNICLERGGFAFAKPCGAPTEAAKATSAIVIYVTFIWATACSFFYVNALWALLIAVLVKTDQLKKGIMSAEKPYHLNS